MQKTVLIHRKKSIKSHEKGKELWQGQRSEKSLSNEWWTQDVLFKELCKEYKIKPRLDVAATYRNAKCEWYIGKKANGVSLDTPWTIPKNKRVTVWCNPPNEFLQEFLFKAYWEWIESGCKQKILMIVPTNCMSSNGFWLNVQLPMDYGEKIFYRPIRGRPEFLENGSVADSSARNAYIAIGWGIDNPHQ